MVSFLLHQLLFPTSLFLTFLKGAYESAWNPVIDWTVLTNGTVFVIIDPQFQDAARYDVCMKRNFYCYGNVWQHETRNKTVVYAVNNLKTEKSYNIWVMPLDSYGDYLLTEWKICPYPVKLSPSSPGTVTEAVPTVPTVTTTKPREGTSVSHSTVIFTVLGVVSLLFLGVVCTIFAVRKGYCRKVFRCLCFQCYRQRTLDILLLYIHEETSHFTRFVVAHAQHISSFVSCNFIDSSKLREKPDPYKWLMSQVKNCHVLVYVSPLLLRYLYREDFPYNNPYHEKIVKAVTSLKQLKRRGKAVFVLSGCSGVGKEVASRLTNLFKLPCHVIVQNKNTAAGTVSLNSSCDLLNELLGTQTCLGHTCFTWIDPTSTSEAVFEAVQNLWDPGLQIRGMTDGHQVAFSHHTLPEEENENLMRKSRQAYMEHGTQNLIACCVSCSSLGPDDHGGNSDLSSSLEDADEVDIVQSGAKVDFIGPDELSCLGSDLSIEECLRRINRKNSSHWH